jgi:hypothetical protein
LILLCSDAHSARAIDWIFLFGVGMPEFDFVVFGRPQRSGDPSELSDGLAPAAGFFVGWDADKVERSFRLSDGLAPVAGFFVGVGMPRRSSDPSVCRTA